MRTMMSTGRSGARRMRFGAVALAASAALLLAACGSSGAKASSSPAGSSPSTTTPAPSSEAIQPIAMTSSSTLGQLLVDSKGMTLYTLSNGGKTVACTGQCLTLWPPLLLPAGESKPIAPGISNLGTATTSGGKQVSYMGAPLHTFSIDKAPGQTNGEGINSFGGTWHVVKISASTSTTSPAAGVPATTPPTTASGGGYGY